MSGDFLLEIVRGEAEPPAIGLSTGEVMGPLSMGPNGSWRMRAPGMIADHGYVYFDGAQLFVRSASPITPISLAGRPVPAAWTPVTPPARIAVAGIEIEFSVVEDAIERTVDRWPAPPPGTASRMSVPPPRTGAWPTPKGARSVPPAPASQPTLIRPTQPASIRPPQAASQTPASRSVVAPSQRPPGRSVVAPSQAPPGASERPPPVKPTADPEVTRLGSVDEIVRRSMAARRETEAAMAAAEAALPPPAPVPTFGPPPAAPSHPPPSLAPAPLPPGPPPAAGPPAPAPGEPGAWAQASLAKKATMLLMPLLLASVYVIFFWQEEPQEIAEGAPSASASTSAAAPTALEPPDPVPSASPVVIGSATPVRPLGAGERTLERRAADAVATGDLEAAARIYEELAQAHPDQPAFSEALRIVRAKLARQR